MSLTLVHIISLGAVAFLTTFLLAPVSKKLSVQLDAIDYPSERRVNTYPVPRLGGFALFGGLLAAMLFEVVVERAFGWEGLFHTESLSDINYVGMLGGVAFMVAVGALDDVKKLPTGLKFLGQVIAAALIASSGVLLTEIRSPLGSELIDFSLFSYPLTILYLVAFANIINLVDGLDGLASGIVGIVAFGLLFVAVAKGRVEAMVLAVILVGICLAFLRYNWHPASLYMGDSGALMLGTLLGVVSLVGVMRSPTFIALIVPIVFAGVPVLDTLFAIIRRIRRGRPVHLFDMDHLHHVLLRNGLDQRQAVLLICGWTAVLAGGGVLISSTHGVLVYVIFVVLALASAFLIWRLGLFASVLRHHYSARPTVPPEGEAEGAGVLDELVVEDDAGEVEVEVEAVPAAEVAVAVAPAAEVAVAPAAEVEMAPAAEVAVEAELPVEIAVEAVPVAKVEAVAEVEAPVDVLVEALSAEAAK
jgi:UDP-GlcNAc:undecaprenyl-phosphate GlcNAc-1-phosphate transferase